MNGYGVFKYPDGEHFQGQVKYGKLYGYAFYKYDNGDEYDG